MGSTDAEADPRPTTSFGRGWTLFRVRDVPVRLDLSWIVICGLVIYVFATRFSALLRPYGTGVVVASAVVATLLFFASIVAHELGHAVTSLDRGIPVASVTLFLLGGVTESTRAPARPRDEIVIVGAGPMISLVLASAFGLLFAVGPQSSPYGVVTGYLAWMNLALAVFNVLPGYPLDGGRLLRAVLWAVTGRPEGSTRWAARVGQVFAAVLIVGGANGLIGGWVPAPDGFVRTAVVVVAANGLWSVLIGFFLLRGAVNAHRHAVERERLERHRVGEVMGQAPPTLIPDMTLEEAIVRMGLRPSLLFPVGEPLVGGVTLRDLEAVPRSEWATTTVGSIASSAEEVTVDVRAPLTNAIDRLPEAPGQMLLVVDDGRPVGLLTPSLLGGLSQ
jgi:Zn-dependent protease/CBS domain-containing protein